MIQFSVGQQVVHNRFGYRGLIFDVDEIFAGTEALLLKLAFFDGSEGGLR